MKKRKKFRKMVKTLCVQASNLGVEVEIDGEQSYRGHTIDLSIKIPSESQFTRDVSDKILVLTLKVEHMNKECFKMEVNNEIAMLNVGVRNDIASLAKFVALLKEAFMRDSPMGEEKSKAPASYA